MKKIVIILLLLILKCCLTTQETVNCTNVIVVRKAEADPSLYKSYGSVPVFNRVQCEGACANDVKCQVSAWNGKTNSCSLYDNMVGNISYNGDGWLYFVSRNDNGCSCLGASNEWAPIMDKDSIGNIASRQDNSTDIVTCFQRSMRENSSFIFDFSKTISNRCFIITGQGESSTTFSDLSYLYLPNLFHTLCSINMVAITPLPSTPPTTLPTTLPATLPATHLPTFSTTAQVNGSSRPAQPDKYTYFNLGDYPLAIRPAYVVLIGLGGGCIIMTLVAVVALCQGKLGGGRRTREISYHDARVESAGIMNPSYDSSLKEVQDETLDLTASKGEYEQED